MTGLDPVTAGGAMAAGSVLNTILDISKGISTAKSRMKPGSMADITQVARVEPLTVIDGDVAYLPELPDILQSLNSLFSGYYIQAIAMLTDVGNIKVVKLLDRLNPNRKQDIHAFIGSFAEAYAAESIHNRLGASFNWKMNADNYKWRLPTEYNRIAMEAEVEETPDRFKPPVPDKVTLKGVTDDKQLLSMSESINLSVGKMINVTLQSNGDTRVIPIAIRLIVQELHKAALLDMLGKGTVDVGLTERFWRWKEGRINFMSDLIFSLDLIKQQKKAVMYDKDGVQTEIMRRQRNNAVAGLMSKSSSLNDASNLFVISQQTADELESRYNLRMKDFASRSRMFDHTNAFIVAVVDREAERVHFYHRGVRQASSLGYRDIKSANKGTGPDIAEILNAYKKGEAPTF